MQQCKSTQENADKISPQIPLTDMVMAAKSNSRHFSSAAGRGEACALDLLIERGLQEAASSDSEPHFH